jgi:probable HAF family extracellular repeat protein
MNLKSLTVTATAFAIALSLSTGPAKAQSRTRYKVVDLGTLGGSNSQAFGLSVLGQVAGTSTTSEDATAHAFLWSNGKIHDLGNLPGGSTSGAAAVNILGQVVGESDNAQTDPNPFLCFTPNECRAFVWQNGTMRDLGALRGGHNSAAGWANDLGLIVGASETTTAIDPVNGVPPFHATAWILGVPIDLGTLGGPLSSANSVNLFGQVTGISQFNSVIDPDLGGPFFHAFLVDRGRILDLSSAGGLGGNQSEGLSINNRRQVVGDADLAGNSAFHAFLWQSGVMTDLGAVESDTFSSAQSIDDLSRVVGWSGDGEEIFRAVIWKNGEATDLNTLVPADTDLYLLVATGINASGAIIGFGVSQSTGELHGYLLQPKVNPSAALATEAEPDATIAKSPVRVKLPQSLKRKLRPLPIPVMRRSPQM